MIGMKRIAAIARRAAEIVQSKGKATGSFQDASGRVCTLGAIRVALAEQGLGYQLDETGMLSAPALSIGSRTNAGYAERIISKQLEAQLGGHTVTSWSDKPTTTVEDIAKQLGQAADTLEVT